MSSALVLIPIVVAVVLAVRWVRSRRHLDLGDALDAPWWLFPLSRLAIYRYFACELAADLWEQLGWVNREGKPIAAWHWIFIDQHNGTWRVRIRVRRGFKQGDEETDGKDDPKREVVNQARGTLDLGRPNVEWKFRLALSHVVLTPRRVLPAKAFFRDRDVRDLVEAELTRNPTALPYMLLGKDEPYSVDLDEIPHVGISAGTGGGKSALIRFLVAAPLWADPRTFAIVADRKEFSQRGLAEIPGVIYAREPEEINSVLLAVWEEVGRRNKECASFGLNRLPDYPRIVLGLEEINITYQSLNSWWRQQGHSKGLAPGVYALDQILCAGRQVKVNCIIEGQDVNSRVISGSGAGTVNIDEWILANYDPNTWNRLAMGHPWVQPNDHHGWCIAIRSRQITEGQRIFMADGEPKHGGRFDAYDWLKDIDHSERQANLEQFMLNGGLLELSRGESPTPRPSKTKLTPELDAGDEEPIDHDEEPNYRTLRELESRPWCPWKPGTLSRYARDPHLEFPEPQIEVVKGIAGRYSERAVREWVEDRLLGGGNKDYGVYFVRWALSDGTSGVKIGMTGNLKGRFRKWNLGTREWPSPFLLHWISCDDKYAADAEEKAQHHKWRDYHDHLELYRLEGELAAWLERRKVAA